MRLGKRNLKFGFGMVSGLFAFVCSAIFLAACTDYEGMLDDEYEAWVKKQEGQQQTFDPADLPSTAVVGSFTDSRDGQTYRTAIIGYQVWMAQNLNYNTANSLCNVEKDADCKKYGRYYTWSAAMTACPSGWHLPCYEDWSYLFSEVGGTSVAATNSRLRVVGTVGKMARILTVSRRCPLVIPMTVISTMWTMARFFGVLLRAVQGLYIPYECSMKIPMLK